MKRNSVTGSLLAALTVPLAVVGLPAAPAAAAPDFQLPVQCGQTWTGQTRSGHSPANAVDLNRPGGDFGALVLAAAGGTVTRVENEGNTSYGRWVEISHGGGWTTRYAHLSAWHVNDGEHVSQGEAIGQVGNSGGSTGSHLHFEERRNGNDVRISFNGSQIEYWGSASYTSRNNCGGFVNTSGGPLQIHSGPSTSKPVTDTLADGAGMIITCQTRGQKVTGTYGTSDVWDKTEDGYVSDTYIFTGADGQVAPSC